jgi:hypothetical protein
MKQDETEQLLIKQHQKKNLILLGGSICGSVIRSIP